MSIQDLIQDSLAQKYAILGQQADSQSLAARAAANLDNVRAGLMPKESAANVANTMASTAMTEKNTSWIDRLNAMGLDLTKSQIGANNANTRETLEGRLPLLKNQTSQIGQLLQMFQLGGMLGREKVSGRGGGYRDIDMRGIRDGY